MKNSSSKSGAKHFRIQNILVPIDFSEMSIRSIATAKRLATRFDANIHLVHVQEFNYPAGFMSPGAPAPLPPVTFYDDIIQRVTADLRELAEKYGIADGNCYIAHDAPVFDGISRTAQKVGADLIVTSTHGRTGLKRVFLGSTAERLVQHAPCPVLVARESKTKATVAPTINRILVPVDFSDCSLGGLNYAIRFAQKFAARILVLNVMDLGPLLTADGYAMYNLSTLEDELVRNTEKGMRNFVRRARFGGVPFTTKVVSGASVDGICNAASSEKADLIISATHGRTGLKHVLIGSTAEMVVRHATCPVLVVPSHPEIRRSNLTHRESRVRKTTKSAAIPRHAPRSRAAKFSRPERAATHPLPERRLTNKFRESHLG